MRSIGNDWYSYEIQGTASASVVFTDCEGQQTSDLFRDQDGWYALPGGWSAKNPELAASPPIHLDAAVPSSTKNPEEVAALPPTDTKMRSRRGDYWNPQ